MALTNILNPNFEWTLNNSLTQEEKDLLRPIIQKIKEKKYAKDVRKIKC